MYLVRLENRRVYAALFFAVKGVDMEEELRIIKVYGRFILLFFLVPLHHDYNQINILR